MARPATGRPRLVIATRSIHKLRELGDLLRLERGILLTLDDLGVPGEPVEDGATFEANARIKARFAAEATGLPSLADDSGIEVDALGGAPGPLSARFGGEGITDEERVAFLLERLAGVPADKRSARFRCLIAVARPEGEVNLFEGRCEGRVAEEPRGETGFGYDPVFLVPERGLTLAELPAEEKNTVSHRGRAARRARVLLEGLLRERGA